MNVEQSVLESVIICGKYSVIKNIDPDRFSDQLRVVIDVEGVSETQIHHTAKVRIESDNDAVWICYAREEDAEDGYVVPFALVKQ